MLEHVRRRCVTIGSKNVFMLLVMKILNIMRQYGAEVIKSESKREMAHQG